MAEGGNNKDNRSFLNKQNEKSDESTGSDAEETNISSRPDLFNENVLNIERKTSGENLTSSKCNTLLKIVFKDQLGQYFLRTTIVLYIFYVNIACKLDYFKVNP